MLIICKLVLYWPVKIKCMYSVNSINRKQVYSVPLSQVDRESSYRVMVKVLNCGIIASKFKLRSCYYVHFWTLEKRMNPFILPAMG